MTHDVLVERLARCDEDSQRWPHALPGGRAVLFTSSRVIGAFDDADLVVLVLATGARKVVQRGGSHQLLLDELPLASFFSTLMTSFFVGLRFRQTLPVGPSIGVVAFLRSSGVRLTSSIVEIFSPAPPDCIIL